MLKLAVIVSCLLNTAYAQFFAQLQNEPQLKWKELSTKNYLVIYPDYLENKAHDTLNWLEYFRPLVSEQYEVESPKLPVVLRPQVALPNGFVTLAPRRSEWFNHAGLTPIVGADDWLVSLAVHELRHVVQYDTLNRSNNRLGYYLMGESLLSVFINITMPTWYFEGDAVWVETTQTDGGRGRSPRFSARLKALLASGQIPKYDDLLAGDYTTNLPNYYVYGYYLITRGYRLFGEKIWKEIAKLSADEPLNPFAIYNSFLSLAGMSFEQFYSETMEELSDKWADAGFYKMAQEESNKEYSESIYPMISGDTVYHFYRDQDSHWELRAGREIIAEFATIPGLSKIGIENGTFVYTQNLPSPRYGFKDYNDLFLFDIKKKKRKRLSFNQRIYHPALSADAKKVAYIEFDKNEKFNLIVQDLNGKKETIHKQTNDYHFAEAVWIDADHLAAFVIHRDGKKQLATVNLRTKEIKLIAERTRNNLYSLSANNNRLYFEADYQGKVNIFEYDLTENKISQCSDEFIAAYNPLVKNEKLYYSSEMAYGKRLKEAPLKCQVDEKINFLFERSLYLSQNSPSDQYHQSPPKDLPVFNENVKSDKSEHNEFSHLLTPHSWNFNGDRGWQVLMQSTNLLNTYGLTAYAGNSSNESKPFAGFSFDIKKYYPIISLRYDFQEREKSFLGEDTEWKESTYGISTLLPYARKFNLFTMNAGLVLATNKIDVSENNYNILSYELNGESLQTNRAGFFLSTLKDKTKRRIVSQYGLALEAYYTDIQSDKTDKTNYFVQAGSDIYLPSYYENHGFKITLNTEMRPDNETLYKLQDRNIPLIGYTFSRGYIYEFTSKFEKITLNYAAPLGYPRAGWSHWIYFPRIYANLFFDHTTILNDELEQRALNSKGVEFFFDTMIFRKFPLSFGLRYLTKDVGEDAGGTTEFFLANSF